MTGHVASSPHLFRPVKRALVGFVLLLLVLTVLVPAPLEAPADPAHPPNPAKSAWFLLWIQELVSYRTSAIYAAVALAIALFALPWLAGRPPERAVWFGRGHRMVAVLVCVAAVLVLTLTVVGLFLRGPDWRLVWPS